MTQEVNKNAELCVSFEGVSFTTADVARLILMVGRQEYHRGTNLEDYGVDQRERLQTIIQKTKTVYMVARTEVIAERNVGEDQKVPS